MDYTCIRTETRDAVGLVVLDRPKVLNALNRQLIEELCDALAGFDADDDIGAMVITGNEKAFAAGADISEMVDKDSMDMFTARHFEGWERFERVRKPVIAAVAGYALGGGCELAMACDIVIAADNARFGQPEIKLGVLPGLGGTQRLPRVAGKAKAMDLCLTARMMDAEEAERSGSCEPRGAARPSSRRGDGGRRGHRVDVTSGGAHGQGGDRPGLRDEPPVGPRRRTDTVQHVLLLRGQARRHARVPGEAGGAVEASLTGEAPRPRMAVRARAHRTRQLGKGGLTREPTGSRLSRILVHSETPRPMKTLPLSEVKAKLSRLVDDVTARDEEVVITRNGVPAAVLVSADEYGSWQETLAVRADATLMQDITDGLRALKEKRSRLYTLEELFE